MTPEPGSNSKINCFRCKIPLKWVEYQTGTFGLFCTQKYCGMAITIPARGVIALDHPIFDTWSVEEKAFHYEEIIKELHPMVTSRTRKSDKEKNSLLPQGDKLAKQI